MNCWKPHDFKLTRLADDAPISLMETCDFERAVVPLDAHFFTKFSIPDGEYQQSFKTHVNLRLAPAMIALARCVDLTVMEKLQYHQGAIAVGTEVRDIILDARKSLNEQRAPVHGRQAILPPAWECDLLRDDLFVHDTPAYSHISSTTGRFLGFDTYTDSACKQGLAFHRQAAAMICRPLSLPPDFHGVRATVQHHDNLSIRCIMQYNMMRQCTDVTLDMLTGTTLLDENLVCRMNRQQDGINMFPTASQMGRSNEKTLGLGEWMKLRKSNPEALGHEAA